MRARKIQKVSQRGLAKVLSGLSDFSLPKAKAEQYSTSGDAAALMLWEASHLGDIYGKVIADLGAGPGRLGIGALLLGAHTVFFVENDKHAVDDLHRNLAAMPHSQIGNIQIIDDDVAGFSIPVDTVIMNPPFGIQRKHADRLFLEKALQIGMVVWSLHDSHGIDFVVKIAAEETFILTHRIPTLLRLPKTMPFHTKKAKMGEVTWLRLQRQAF